MAEINTQNIKEIIDKLIDILKNILKELEKIFGKIKNDDSVKTNVNVRKINYDDFKTKLNNYKSPFIKIQYHARSKC